MRVSNQLSLEMSEQWLYNYEHKRLTPLIKRLAMRFCHKSFPHAFANGFTLIEVLVVVVIVGILGSLAVPRVQPLLASIRMISAVDNVKKRLVTAKIRAVANPFAHCGVYFNVTEGTLLLFLDDNTNNHAYDAGVDEVYLVEWSLPQGISFSETDNTLVDDVVLFRGDGSAKYGGSIHLVDTFGRNKTVNVLAATGRVRVQ